MPVFTDLEKRLAGPPFDLDAYNRRFSGCRTVAEHMPLVHVTGQKRPFLTTMATPPQEIPTSTDRGYYSDHTRRAESLLGLSPSAYFYAGRAHPDFGSIALAFAPDCEGGHTGSVSPFDTGGLLHENRYINVRLNPADGETERAAYGRASEIPLRQWREVFARVLAAYFMTEIDYWQGRPRPFDPERLYELNSDWRAWAFEVRFYQGQSIYDRAAWCADEDTMASLRRQLDSQAPATPGDPLTPLERFLLGPSALEAAGTPYFCERMELWARSQCMA